MHYSAAASSSKLSLQLSSKPFCHFPREKGLAPPGRICVWVKAHSGVGVQVGRQGHADLYWGSGWVGGWIEASVMKKDKGIGMISLFKKKVKWFICGLLEVCALERQSRLIAFTSMGSSNPSLWFYHSRMAQKASHTHQQSQKEKDKDYDTTCIWNLKCDTDEPI